jgi:hypothetical protein
MLKRLCLCIGLLGISGIVWSQDKPPKLPEKPQMKFLGAFDGGQPGVGIYKMFDATDDVVCYILMPEVANRRKTEDGWVYDGNSVGSISCLKVKVPVIPIGEKSR